MNQRYRTFLAVLFLTLFKHFPPLFFQIIKADMAVDMAVDMATKLTVSK